MPRTTPILAGLAVVAAIALGACSAGAAAQPPTADPSVDPVATPVVTPDVTPAPVVTPAPTDPGSDAMPVKVDLANETGHDVYLDVVDRSGGLVRAWSGEPGDGASVAWSTGLVEQVDARTLRLTWTDTPGDNALALYVDEAGTGLTLVQPAHAGQTDSIALDRILLLEFDAPVSAADVTATLREGLAS